MFGFAVVPATNKCTIYVKRQIWQLTQKFSDAAVKSDWKIIWKAKWISKKRNNKKRYEFSLANKMFNNFLRKRESKTKKY